MKTQLGTHTSLALILFSTGAFAQSGQSLQCFETMQDQSTGNCVTVRSDPFLGSLYPLSTDFNLNNGGRVGIGTTTSYGRLHVVSNGLHALLAENFAATGTEAGVVGATYSASNHASGIIGAANHASGGDLAAGVYGYSLSSAPTGAGVRGRASSSSSFGYGVTGFSQNGAGVFGHAPDSVGVFGVSESAQGGYFGTDEGSAAVRAISTSSGGASHGVWGSQSGAGAGVVGEMTSNTGGVGVWGVGPSGSYGVVSSGAFVATGSKAFAQPHPVDPSKELRFVCLEGNESGTYCRGSQRLTGGRALVEVPEEFRLASEADGLTVQVTALGNARLWVEHKDNERFVVRGDADVEFDWFLNGVRRGYRDYEPVVANRFFVPSLRDEPFGGELDPDVRQILVETGILNRDFTPNDVTAARLGWTLRDKQDRDPMDFVPRAEPFVPEQR